MSRQYIATAAECCAVYSSLLSSSTTMAAARPMFISRYWSLSSFCLARWSFSRTRSLNMYWLAKSGTKSRTTATMPACGVEGGDHQAEQAPAWPANAGTAASPRARRRARRLPYLTYMPTLTTARFVGLEHDGRDGAGRQKPHGDRRAETRRSAYRSRQRRARPEGSNHEVGRVEDDDRCESSHARRPRARAQQRQADGAGGAPCT